MVCFAVPAVCLAAAPEPRLQSMHPFSGRAGSSFEITVRGAGLDGATAVYSPGGPRISVLETGADPASKAKTKTSLVRLKVDAPVTAGRYPVRLVTPGGVSNALPLHIVEHAVTAEPEGVHDTPEAAVVVTALPAVYAGQIRERGESDLFAFDAAAGRTLTFEVLSGLPAPGAAGGNARGFDPSISIWEQGGSWFDPKRLNRIAFNDEPLWVLGQPTDAHLVHTFAKAGRYFLRLEAFSGQGGPDYAYQLKILPGRAAPDRAEEPADWQERGFGRRLAADRLNQLAARGGKPRDQKAVETYRTAPLESEPARFQLPATLEGVIGRAGEAHHARFHADGPRDIAIELETPDVAAPLFNPLVRLLDAGGEEVATTILAGKGACTGALTKSLQSKVIVPLRNPGDYTVQVRNLTSDLGEAGFRYRIQVRPQVAHVGQVRVDTDVVNLAAGGAKTVRVSFDREEDYRGAVAVSVEPLPPGVEALAAADFEPDKDPPAYTGKRERYVPRTERVVVAFTAAAHAPPAPVPVAAKVVVRPIAGGKPGEPLAANEILLMVVKP
jgi:hypothetical protein